MVVTVTSGARADLAGGAGLHRARRRRQAGRYLLAALAALAAATVALAGCSSSSGTGGTSGSSGGSSGTAGTGSHAKVSLAFQLDNGPGTPVIKHWTLNCEPSGGSQANAAAACTALLRLKDPFAPPAAGVACPMFLLSNRKIVVTGTWFGVRVHRTVADGGCDVALFGKLNRLFG